MPCPDQGPWIWFHGARHRSRKRRIHVPACCVSFYLLICPIQRLTCQSGPDPNEVLRAKELCLDLLANVRTQYEQFKERGPRRRDDREDFGDRRYRDDRNNSYNGGYAGGRDGARDARDGGYGQERYNGGYGQDPQAATAMSPAAAGTPDYAQAYAQYYQQNGQDPYAAYGGYEAYTRMYWQYYQQQQAGVPGAAEQTSDAPPPPPNDDAPPPPGASSGSYNSVSSAFSNSAATPS